MGVLASFYICDKGHYHIYKIYEKKYDEQVSELGTSTGLHDFMLAQSPPLIAFTAQAPVVLLLTYFLLAAGSHFLRKLYTVGGNFLVEFT
jgi:hypothetical protein